MSLGYMIGPIKINFLLKEPASSFMTGHALLYIFALIRPRSIGSHIL